jgi:hypothetical protein
MKYTVIYEHRSLTQLKQEIPVEAADPNEAIAKADALVVNAEAYAFQKVVTS